MVDEVSRRTGGLARRCWTTSRSSVRRGEVLALVGRSGSGKTTLCHLVAGLGRPTSGRIAGGRRPTRTTSTTGPTVSLLPQRLGLVEELTVEQNVLLPPARWPAGRRRRHAWTTTWSRTARPRRAAPRDRRATQTSLGEQQRTALARALVLRPRLAVLDEPTGHQDDEHVELVVAALDVARRHGVAVLVATHDERMIGAADRVVTLASGRQID